MKVLVKIEICTDGDFTYKLTPCFVPSGVDDELHLGAFDNISDALEQAASAVRMMNETKNFGGRSHFGDEFLEQFAEIIYLHRDCPIDSEKAQEYWSNIAEIVGAEELQDRIQQFMSCCDDNNLFFDWDYGNYHMSVEFITHDEEDVISTYRKYAHLYH